MDTLILTKEMNRVKQQLFSLRRMRDAWRRPADTRNRQQMVLEETAGALRASLKGDLVSWQRTIRREWEQRRRS